MQSSLVPPSFVKVEHEKFHKFVSSIVNLVVLLDTYTYDSKLKNVNRKIIKRNKFEEDVEEVVIKDVEVEWWSIQQMS